MHKQAHTASSPDRTEQSLGIARRLRVSLRLSSLRCTLFGAARTRMIVAEVPQEVSDPTVDSQIITLAGPKAVAIYRTLTLVFRG